MPVLPRLPLPAAACAALLLAAWPHAHALDKAAAESLVRQNNCLRCHTVDATKEKDGPAFTKVAEKYRGQGDAETRLLQHLISGEIAKFRDGHEEAHKVIRTSPPNDPAQIRNLVQWILAH